MSLTLVALASVLVGQTWAPKQPSKTDFVAEFEAVDTPSTLYARDRARGQYRVRLYGISEPRAGDIGYGQANFALKDRLGRFGDLYLEYEPGQPKKERGDRVAYVWEGRKLVNLDLVRTGWVKASDKAFEGKYGDAFRAAQEEAHKYKRGLWNPELKK